jgi:hypothetical protein
MKSGAYRRYKWERETNQNMTNVPIEVMFARVLKAVKKAKMPQAKPDIITATMGVSVKEFTLPTKGGNTPSREKTWKTLERPYTEIPVEVKIPTLAPAATMYLAQFRPLWLNA